MEEMACMPTYEYRRKKCGHEFERFQKITADPVAICPECGGAVERLIAAGGGFILKGSGFYATDYAQRESVTRCGKEGTCCGRKIPCDVRPCDN
jgi:putative FmdB family regulatory protein